MYEAKWSFLARRPTPGAAFAECMRLNVHFCTGDPPRGPLAEPGPIDTNLVAAAHALDRPVMLGAYTPTEAQAAHEAGSDFVKIFPADTLGPSYIKALLAPLPHLRIVPTGGVNLDTMEAFLAAGSAALGVGSALLKKELVAGENWAELERLAKRFADRLAELKAGPGQ